MPISVEAERTVQASEILMTLAAISSGASLLVLAIDPILFSIVLSASLLLALGSLIWRLFGAVQLQLGELLILIAVLGNVVGLTVMGLLGSTPRAREIPAIAFVLIIGLVWFLGGVTNGLLCARRLEVNDFGGRLAMVLSLLIYPIAIAGLWISALAGLICLLSAQPEFILALVSGFISFILWLPGREYRKSARLTMTRVKR